MKIALLCILSACSTIDAASCPKGDVECVVQSLDPSDMKTALKYAGPCYRMGRDLCNSAESCVGDIDREQCTDWWIDNVCLAGFDPAEMNRCANSVQLLGCNLWAIEDWSCAKTYPHPLAGISGF
jgi:hypothetical protein